MSMPSAISVLLWGLRFILIALISALSVAFYMIDTPLWNIWIILILLGITCICVSIILTRFESKIYQQRTKNKWNKPQIKFSFKHFFCIWNLRHFSANNTFEHIPFIHSVLVLLRHRKYSNDERYNNNNTSDNTLHSPDSSTDKKGESTKTELNQSGKIFPFFKYFSYNRRVNEQ
jgi:hypothetical protein